MVTFRTYHSHIAKIVYIAFIAFSCTKENPSRHLNLGNWYLQRGLVELMLEDGQ